MYGPTPYSCCVCPVVQVVEFGVRSLINFLFLAVVQASLERLQMDYVDLLYCHRPDPNTPMIETVSTGTFCSRIDIWHAVACRVLGCVTTRRCVCAGLTSPVQYFCDCLCEWCVRAAQVQRVCKLLRTIFAQGAPAASSLSVLIALKTHTGCCRL